MKESGKVSTKTIAVLLAALLILSAAGCLFLWLTQRGGTQVVVTVDGQVYGKYPLNRDLTQVIGPEDGSWHNTLRIQDGAAAIIESDCANQICVHTPPLREEEIGIIVCLPHGLVAELK